MRVFFDSYCQPFISAKKPGHLYVPPTTFDIFIIFPDSKIDFKILSLNSLGKSSNNSWTKLVVVHTNFHFTCGDLDLSEFIKKFQNFMTRIVFKFSFDLYFSNDDSTFYEKYQFWLKNVTSFRKQQISQVESFLKSNFDLNQGYKIMLTQNHQIW